MLATTIVVALPLALALAPSCNHEPRSLPLSDAASPTDVAPSLDIGSPVDSQLLPPGAQRLVAIGDLHGDLTAARRALRLAGALNERDEWIGGKLIVIQTGDQLDRGDEDRAVLELFDRVAPAAQQAGGQLLSLVGNHEVMNVEGWMDYVTAAGYRVFEGLPGLDLNAAWLSAFPAEQRPRRAALAPGGSYARRLAKRSVVVQLDGSVFAHGGLTTQDLANGFERINTAVKNWMLGEAAEPTWVTANYESLLWSTVFATMVVDSSTCTSLRQLLQARAAKRLVIGHTIQSTGINSACGGQVWRIDVGMSKYYYSGPVQVLEIVGDRVRVLAEP